MVLALVSGCALIPYSGATISGNTISFDGLTDVPDARVRIDMYDWLGSIGDHYYALVETRSGTTPVIPAGWICPNQPALYQYRATGSVIWGPFWKRNPTTGRYEAKVRATQFANAGEMRLKFTDNPSGQSCMAEHGFNDTCDFYALAYNTCGYRLNEAIVQTTDTFPGNGTPH